MGSTGTVIIQSLSCLLAFLAAIILLWVNLEKTHSNRMLAFLLLILSLLNFNQLFFHNGWYMIFPWFHKMAIPFSLLVMPVAYVYVRSLLLGELKLRRSDWLLLLPSILYAINLLPYYTMPLAEKRNYLSLYYNQISLRTKESEGFLPAYIFPVIRVLWSLCFIVLNYRLIRNFKKQANEKVLADNTLLLKWVTLLNGLLALLIAGATFVAVIAPIKKSGFSVLDLSLGAVVLVICLQLFLRPKLLYGIYQPTLFKENDLDASLQGIPVSGDVLNNKEIKKEVIMDDKLSVLIITPEDALRYKKTVEHFFQEQLPFLKTDYSLEQLVADTHIPRYILSSFINREYGMGFREFINRYRVDYLIKNLDNPAWKQFTLEAIAAECGFSSRITFFNNFKQITGLSPSEYIRAHQKNNSSQESL